VPLVSREDILCGLISSIFTRNSTHCQRRLHDQDKEVTQCRGTEEVTFSVEACQPGKLPSRLQHETRRHYIYVAFTQATCIRSPKARGQVADQVVAACPPRVINTYRGGVDRLICRVKGVDVCCVDVGMRSEGCLPHIASSWLPRNLPRNLHHSHALPFSTPPKMSRTKRHLSRYLRGLSCRKHRCVSSNWRRFDTSIRGAWTMSEGFMGWRNRQAICPVGVGRI
jgi:hypothetical protein